MPEVAPIGTDNQTSPSTSSIEITTAISRIGPNMKKDKSSALQEQDRDQELVNGGSTDQKEIDTNHEPDHNDSDNITDANESIAESANTNEDQAKQDVSMRDASPASASTEQDSPMVESVPIRGSNGTGTTEGISQEDLDGGLLDGALDDYDDLDQDTEDTEVGNVEDDFSDDDDDDDVDDKADHSEMHSPDGISLDDVAKSDDRDMDTADESADHHDKSASAIHSEDSDSDLPEPEGSDNEHEDDEDEDDEEDEDGDEDDGEDEDLDDEDEDEEPVKKTAEPKKETILSQKPVLNRPPAPEEELKDSGDDLSDLSEFDDTDDSDEEDDDVPETKPSSKESNTNSSSAAPASTTPINGKSLPGGRKRSLHDTSKDADKQTQESIKTEQDDQAEVPNGRARLTERKAPEAEDEHHSDKESSSEVPEEEKTVEEEEEDMETKQLHKDALEALTSIEVEFANLRDKMYEERMTELDREVEMINAGTHPELSSLMQEIEQKREQRLRFADMGKKYLIDIAQSAYQVAEYRAHCTFQSERRTTRSELMRGLGKKQRQMMMELTLSSETNKRKVIDDKSTLIRARKLRRMEVNELKSVINDRHCFPGNTKLNTITNAELNNDFAAMGLARLLPQVNPGEQAVIPPKTAGHMPPSMPIPPSAMSSRLAPGNPSSRWGSGMGYPPPSNMSQSGGYYGSKPDVEIYIDGDRCMIDGIWYRPNDHVVVLDAAIGKYNAKYLYLSHEEIMLQRTDGSKTRLHLGLFRGRKLCMQPKS